MTRTTTTRSTTTTERDARNEDEDEDGTTIKMTTISTVSTSMSTISNGRRGMRETTTTTRRCLRRANGASWTTISSEGKLWKRRRASGVDAAKRGVVPRASAGDALAPPAVFEAACGAAEKKGAQTPTTTLTLGFSAGALIGFGALLMTCVGGASPALASANPGLSAFLKGAIGLPAGLTMVILTGGELFTGNVMVMLSGLLTGAVDAGKLARSWALSYVGNFAGSVFMAWMAYTAMAAAAPAATAAAVGIATTKASLPFGVAVAKGVLCNWLVCLAVWGTMATTSVAGKILAIFWPITTFVALGFEHSVANMFLIPHGMLFGADVTFAQMMTNNIIPVTIGNVIGAAVFVAGVNWLAYGKK